jgi:hypothetical protein
MDPTERRLRELTRDSSRLSDDLDEVVLPYWMHDPVVDDCNDDDCDEEGEE